MFTALKIVLTSCKDPTGCKVPKSCNVPTS
uniref:Uncharacterized protein n=1 Tax=Anguilla anguilla TaxID=7936 RepID=A0A0E9Q1C6_ANGAN